MLNTIVACDIETPGLYPTPDKFKIFCIAVNDGKSIRVYTNPEQVRALLEDPRIIKVFHNALFDCFWIKRVWGITVVNVWCTLLGEKVIIGESLPISAKDEQLKQSHSASLRYTLYRYGLTPTLMNKEMSALFATRPLSLPLTKAEIEYAKDDVRWLLHLQAMQERRLSKLDLMRVMNLENRCIETTVAMRNRGLGFSTSIWRQIARETEAQYNELHKRLPPVVDNWNSPQQAKRYFNARGIPVDSLTGIEELENIYNDKVLSDFIAWRAVFKNVTTYGESWLEDSIKGKTVDADGRIRSDFEQMVNTGRYSSSHPNLQNVPKDGKHRAAFIPAKGNVFVIGDFSGQEIGIMAAAAKEEIWIKAILRREDIHSLTASLLYTEEWRTGTEKGCTFPKKCKCKTHVKVREIAKVINFAIAYGAGSTNIAAKVKITPQAAIKLLNKYRRVVPRLTRWLRENANSAIKTRISYSADPYKRRRTMRDPEDWMLANIGKNNPVQAAGANMLKLSMVSLKKDTPIVVVIHDEIALEVPKREAKRYAKELKIVMEKAADYCTGVPGLIEVEPRIATNLLKI